MPFKVTDNQTGRVITFEKKPSEADIHEAFGLVDEPKKMSLGRKALDVLGGTAETVASVATGIPAWGLGVLGGIAKTATSGDVEGKKTREEIMDYFTYKPRTASGEGATNIAGRVMSPLGVPRKVLTALGGEQWGNLGDVLTMGLLPKAPSAVRAVRNAPLKAGQWLYGKQLMPKGTLKEAKGKVTTGFSNKYTVSDAGWNKFKGDLNKVGRDKNLVLAANQGLFVDFKDIIAPLDRLTSYAEKTSTPISNKNIVVRVKTQLEKQWLEKYPDGKIPLEEVQAFKETLYKRNEASFGELKKAMSPEIEKAIASGARNVIETALPELGVVNRQFKPLLEFYDDFEKALKFQKYERFNWTNTLYNNSYLMTKLVKIFRAISPEHPLGNTKALSAALQSRMQKEYPVNFEEGTPPATKPVVQNSQPPVQPGYAKPYPLRAMGGTVKKGKPYIVGEKGAEVFVPDKKGTIIPHSQMVTVKGIRAKSGKEFTYTTTVEDALKNHPEQKESIMKQMEKK
jgi:hypothetical protein